MNDDQAIIAMVDSNLQREKIKPSEKAFAYKMRLEAMKHQGKKLNTTSEQVEPKLYNQTVELYPLQIDFNDKKEYSDDDRKLSVAGNIKRIWEWQKNVYIRLEHNLDSAIEKVDNLSVKVRLKDMEQDIISHNLKFMSQIPLRKIVLLP